jgi:NAD(P)-dependent dehydrogenase (short-subunit alcohol dehydrogenase family)
VRILKNLVDDLKEKVVLVTGAAGGMGSKSAVGFAGCGANVLASNIDQ